MVKIEGFKSLGSKPCTLARPEENNKNTCLITAVPKDCQMRSSVVTALSINDRNCFSLSHSTMPYSHCSCQVMLLNWMCELLQHCPSTNPNHTGVCIFPTLPYSLVVASGPHKSASEATNLMA